MMIFGIRGAILLVNINRKGWNSSFHYEDPGSLYKLQTAVSSLVFELDPSLSRPLVILCIGTDRATGDCLGPLVGTRLHSLTNKMEIYGTLQHPVHASNLQDVIGQVYSCFSNPLIGAIDACLGNTDRIGYINIRSGSIKPGTALKKTLPEVGDFHISGVVNVGGFFEHMVLQNTRLYLVYRMAELIAKGLFLAGNRLSKNNSISFPSRIGPG